MAQYLLCNSQSGNQNNDITDQSWLAFHEFQSVSPTLVPWLPFLHRTTHEGSWTTPSNTTTVNHQTHSKHISRRTQTCQTFHGHYSTNEQTERLPHMPHSSQRVTQKYYMTKSRHLQLTRSFTSKTKQHTQQIATNNSLEMSGFVSFWNIFSRQNFWYKYPVYRLSTTDCSHCSTCPSMHTILMSQHQRVQSQNQKHGHAWWMKPRKLIFTICLE